MVVISLSLVNLYGFLASSSSIFIGILTALLVNRISNLKAEKNRIQTRMYSIESNLKHFRSKKDRTQDEINDIESKWKKEARKRAKKKRKRVY